MKISRRGLLRAASSASLLLPFERLAHRTAQAQVAHTQRLLIMFSWYGTETSQWLPSAEGRSFNYGRILEPLTPYKDRVLTLSGISIETAQQYQGDGHQRGVVGALTGTQWSSTGGQTENSHTEQSIDQHVASLISRTTSIPSLETAIDIGADGMVYRAREQTLPMPSNSSEIWQRAFANFSPAGMGNNSAARRRSLLDFQLRRAQELAPRLSAGDRTRMDEYMTMLRDIETRVGAGGATSPMRSVPGQVDPGSNSAERMRNNTDLALAALTCGVTNVATMSWAPSTNDHQIPHISRFNDHVLSHKAPAEYGGGNPEAALSVEEMSDLITQRCRWQAEEFARVLAHFASIPEGDGTMLDNTLVFWVNDMHDGEHNHRDLPLVLAGNVKDSSGQSYFDSGRHVRFPDATPINRLLLTIAKAYGSPLDAFGDANFSGPELETLRRG